ncbi:NAD(P)/FAD-dependent oxidoreductase [uncultured Formosa sp.]|uniref:FAD-dependent oxidoreductase n=1 Tax=uncultured Formosa sp. TaxID=255435 RepID=UPI002601EFA7|nr:NAD(P)/FAD-dependent oxidoreductase [uncultured Formosa sp.]
MKKEHKAGSCWTICNACQGQGKKRRRLNKMARQHYQNACKQFENDKQGAAPRKPKGNLYSCTDCSGSGIVASDHFPLADTSRYPHVAIIGGGIGGMALAVACLHRGIPFTLYERDSSFDVRSQGYGLTLQQASKAMSGFGISEFKDGIVSTRHVVHTTDGTVIGEWGMRKWLNTTKQPTSKRTNVHIARQALRQELMEQLGGGKMVQWNHQFVGFKSSKQSSANLQFLVNGETKHVKADVVVGADGIRSAVRKLLIGDIITPLRYLGCIVILGICPLEALDGLESDLLDSATVFQTANGNERIYIMPFSKDKIMWQLSFPMAEEEAISLSSKGAFVLKEEACSRTQWHDPIPQIMAATQANMVSGYPVYDRALLKPELMEQEHITLIGDAAHPMSPFKGQGANQALLDALSLAREITRKCKPDLQWKQNGIRTSVLTAFEREMITRSTSKVKDSAAAAKFLHSEIVLEEGNEPRGRSLKRK